MEGIPTPTIDWNSSNLVNEWEKFEEHVKLIFQGPLSEKTEEQKVNYLLLWVGARGREIKQTWVISNAEAKKLNTFYKRFKSYVQPKLNPIFARYKFFNEVQGSDSFDAFLTRLRISARECQFHNNDEMIRDRIVFGTNSAKAREKLINEGEKLTLDKTISIMQNLEYCQEQLKAINANNIDAVKKRPSKPDTQPSQRRRQQQPRRKPPTTANSKCSYCGYNKHQRHEQCPARNATCNKCGFKDHFARVCRNKSVHELDLNGLNMSDNSDQDTFFVDMVNTCTSSKNLSPPEQAFVVLSVGPSQTPLKFKIDTGSSADVIPVSHFEKLKISYPLEPPDNGLTSYTGNSLPIRGMIRLNLGHNGVSCLSAVYIVESNSVPLLSLNTCLTLGLVKLTYSIDTCEPLDKSKMMTLYGDLFKGVGTMPGEASLHIRPDATPVINPPRRVPEALREKLKQELNRMEKEGIVEKVTVPTDFVNSLVIVEKKSGQLRVCIDSKNLNDAIKRPHYPMRTIDDVTSRLTGAKYFSILDVTHAYWSVKLDEKSSFLTTFSTVFGRYRWLRLPYGISASSDIFMQKIDEVFEGLDGLTAIVDDILVYGRSREEHDLNLKNALERARSKGVKFNPDKCVIGVTEVPFFGHLITSTGLKPDPSKIEAIANLEVPKTRRELENILGMANYMQKFAPNLAEVTSPMRALLKKDVEFLWDVPQTQSFDKMKDIITHSPVLAYFDPKQPVILECDSSLYGCGAALFQNGRPVAFASKTLTETESRYANIEREMNAIVFSCSRFHQYIYGRKVTVHSDNKPLCAIMQKHLCACPPRLQRMRLALSKYDLDVQFVPGKEIPTSDLLSRQPLKLTFENNDLDIHVHTVLKGLHISDRRLESLRLDTKNDVNMQLLKQTIIDGWPISRADCKAEIVEFFNHRDELSVADDLIFRGQTIVIPATARKHLIEAVHQGHFGVEKTTLRARELMFWPGMAKQISDYVSQCSVCQKHRYSNAKEPLEQHEIPDRPWQNIAADLFTLDDKDYLITTDYYSRFFEIDLLTNKQSLTVIRKLKVHMARYGICQKLVTDNGPEWSSKLFADFANDWGFTHVTSSPLHPISNGLIEKTVSIAKRLLRKAKESNRDPYLAILEYRNTPLECGFSPNQLLMGRRTKSILPITNAQLQPRTIEPKLIKTDTGEH
ncbi:uncharacterized protein K02A2.6-like [Mercenaria mercenaria]|uniref:uncharacterized protein K02A2.6-like n=1 Tax=Mercenaria mercenaria TaxID=6596 RepID=UPI00234F09E5|nr:uncharacterized protein K02A2.6-like [Mercenaria mercenaria]